MKRPFIQIVGVRRWALVVGVALVFVTGASVLYASWTPAPNVILDCPPPVPGSGCAESAKSSWRPSLDCEPGQTIEVSTLPSGDVLMRCLCPELRRPVSPGRM